MNHWRITKYDPRFRDERGAFQKDEWTSFSDIGREYEGVEFTLADYEKIEGRYLNAAKDFAISSGVERVFATEVESWEGGFVLREATPITVDAMQDVIRAVLRGLIWCKLESNHDFYIHFGYDCYMYIGCQSDLPQCVARANNSGLFVENCTSPYLSSKDY